MDTTFHSGFVSFVGRPNAGKSSLINALVGQKVAITSHTAQTTRRPLRALLNTADSQLVLVDTPGLHKPVDALGEALNRSSLEYLDDIDAIVMVIDASAAIGRGDEWVVERIKGSSCPKVLALNKIDRVDKAQLQAQRKAGRALLDWTEIYDVSAKDGRGVLSLRQGLQALMPVGPQWFPASMTSDEPFEETLEEIVREKILRNFRDEVPHSVAVKARSVTYEKRRNLWSIEMVIYSERSSQKGILIGAGGSALKKIGTQARADMEKLTRGQVFLDLKVEVKRHWRRDLNQIDRFGYGSTS